MLGVIELLQQLLNQMSGLVPLLEEAEDLVDLVGDDVSILVFLVFAGGLSLPARLGIVFPVLFTWGIF
jgi:hypothetical protein